MDFSNFEAIPAVRYIHAIKAWDATSIRAKNVLIP